jgi:hypothetical protein
MKKILFLSCFCVTAAARALPANNSDIGASTAPAAAVSTMPPVGLTWDYTPKELYVDGGDAFKDQGRKYSLKLGFMRGAYEPFVKNYKSIPVFILTDITDGPEKFLVWNAGLVELDEPFIINAYGGKQLSVLLKQNEVTVFRHKSKDAPGEKVAVFPYKELRALWAENAARYKVILNSGPAYFVPQAFYNQSGCNSVGYVASMPDPYFADTGLPLDFVELYRYTKASTDRRRTTYSIPLGISLTLSADNGKKWMVNEIEKTSLYDALDDEADRPDDCNRTLREAMKQAEKENK